jgi:large subunit ribosomal protein L32e
MNMKKRKKFLRQNWFRHPRLGKKWRRPRGKQSKMRRKFAGKPPVPSVGYKKSEELRGLVSGFKPVVISNVEDLQKIKSGQAAILASGLGAKRKLELEAAAKAAGIRILNLSALSRAHARVWRLEQTKAMKTKKESG